METFGGLLALLALVGLALAVIGLVRPMPKLGLRNRARAGLALVASVVVFFIGAAMLPPVPEVEAAPDVASRSISEPTTPSSRLVNVRAEEVKNDLQPLLDRMAAGSLYPGLPNPQIMRCGGEDTLCQMDQLNFLREWEKAYSGDYGAQRNVAFCFRASSTCGVAPDRVQGCAWRAVIIDAADPEMGDGDVSNFEVECGPLSQAGRIAADSHAARIKTLIAQRRS